MKMGLYLTAILSLCLGPAQGAWAGAGTTGGQVLAESYGARAAGLAGAFGAQHGTLESVHFNPAGLADLDKVDIQFMHVAGIENMLTEWLAGAVPVPGLGTLAAQVLYRGQPSIDNQVNGEAAVDAKDLVIGLGYARPIAAGFSAGVNAKFLSLTLGPANASALAFDAGVQYALDESLRFGLAVRHAGEAVKFHNAGDALPTVGTFAVLWSPASEGPHSVNLELDADYQQTEDNWVGRAGAEYWFKRLLALRLGYAYSVTRSIAGLTAGVGFKFKVAEGVNMNVDFSLQPQMWESSDFELVNRVGLGVTF
jgi:opacity protein-like surface antigen